MTLDINDARTVLTVMGLVCFIAITLWAFSGRARKGFDEAALLPFSEAKKVSFTKAIERGGAGSI